MRIVIGEKFRRWSSSSIAFRRRVTGILLVTQNTPLPHYQITESAAGFGHAKRLPPPAASLCAGHAQQFGGESPPANLMEVKA